MPWYPGDPWPDATYPGGAIRDGWSGFVRLIVQARIASGVAFHMGPHPNDRLNDGNVMSLAGGLPGRTTAAEGGLWVDLTCDLTDLEVTLGAETAQGLLTKSAAGTLDATLWDPEGKYDPLNGEGIYSLGGATRLIPGAPVRAFCEVIAQPNFPTPPTVLRYPLFTGTADRWETTWTRWDGERFAHLVATDSTKQWARFDREEQPPQGLGDDMLTRLNRLKNLYGWAGTVTLWGTEAVTLGETTMAQSGWELANRVVDDELGFVYFPPQPPTATFVQGMLALGRSIWSTKATPSLHVGCQDPDATILFWDIATDVAPVAFDDLLRNTVRASRSGGTMQTVQNGPSVAEFGEMALQRTDLGLQNDQQVAEWGQLLVNKGAFPQTALDHLTMEPAVAPDLRPARVSGPWQVWQAVLGAQTSLVSSSVEVVFDESPNHTADITARIVGTKHKVTPFQWEVTYQTVPATVVTVTQSFHMGPHAQDRLDAGWLMGG